MRSAGLELPSDPIGCSPRGSAMKRPLYYLLCAIACTSMVSATMPMAAIADAIQPQSTAAQQAQTDTATSDTDKAEDTTSSNATGSSDPASDTEDNSGTPAGATSATDTATPAAPTHYSLK